MSLGKTLYPLLSTGSTKEDRKSSQQKLHLKMLSGEVVSCMQMLTSGTYLGIQANSVGPNQTAPTGAV